MNNQFLNISILGLLLAFHSSMGIFTIEANAIFCVSFALLLVVFFKHIRLDNLDTIDLIAFGYLIFTTIGINLLWDSFGVPMPYLVQISVVAFIVLRRFFREWRKAQRTILWAIITGSLFEVLLALGQQHGIIPNANDNFVYGGSLGNQGALACYFSVCIPILLSVSFIYNRNKKNENLSYIILLCLLVMTYYVIVSKSRSAWIATLISSAYIYNREYRITARILQFFRIKMAFVVAFVTLIGITIALSVALYQFKPDSVLGRTFIWKVALSAQHQNFFSGDGIGTFYANYGKWQEAYFENKVTTETEQQLADYVTCAYNEILEIGIEQGVLGVLLFFSLFIVALSIKPKTHIAAGSKASLISILIISFFTYPFQMPMIIIHYFVFLAVVLSDNKKQLLNMPKTAKAMLTTLAVMPLVFYAINIYGQGLFRKAIAYASLKNYDKATLYYNRAYPILSDNASFLSSFALMYYENKQYDNSIAVLLQAKPKSSNPSINMLLGNNYKELKQYNDAIREYSEVSYMIPSRLFPKYQIALIYKELNDSSATFNKALEIVNMPVKVPSSATKTIKKEMQHIVDDYSAENATFYHR